MSACLATKINSTFKCPYSTPTNAVKESEEIALKLLLGFLGDYLDSFNFLKPFPHSQLVHNERV